MPVSSFDIIGTADRFQLWKAYWNSTESRSSRYFIHPYHSISMIIAFPVHVESNYAYLTLQFLFTGLGRWEVPGVTMANRTIDWKSDRVLSRSEPQYGSLFVYHKLDDTALPTRLLHHNIPPQAAVEFSQFALLPGDLRR